MAPKRRRLAAFADDDEVSPPPPRPPSKKALYLPGRDSDGDDDDAPAPAPTTDYMTYAPEEARRPRAPPPAEPCAKAGAREREAEARGRGLETPLDDSNKGFRMLRAMGYRAGALGGRGGIEAPVVPAALARHGGAPRPRGLGADAARDRARRAVADARLQAAAALERRAAAFHGGVADRTLRRATEAAAGRARGAARDLDERAGLPPSPIWPAEVADVPSRAFADASGAAYAAALGDAPEPPGGLDGEPPEVQLRAAAAYLRSAHGYCLATGGAASDMDLEAELARLVDDATD